MNPVQAIQQAAAYWAQQFGVDQTTLTNISLATAQQESGLNPNAVGDNGTSFGLFQLHQGGELGSLTPQQAEDPLTNAMTAIQQIASVLHAHPNWTPGDIAAAAQRPANPSTYASDVNAIYSEGASAFSGLANTPAPSNATPGAPNP